MNPGRYGQSYGGLLVHPGGVSRLWGVNSFTQPPEHGGEFTPDVPQRIIRRAPRLTGLDTCLKGPWGRKWGGAGGALGRGSGVYAPGPCAY